MSMSTFVKGIKPPNGKWKAMKAAWDACEKAGVPAPAEVVRFFEGEPPDPVGVVVDIKFREFRPHDSDIAYEVDLAELPKDVKIVRFVNSW